MKVFKSKYLGWVTVSLIIGGIIFIPLLFVLEGFVEGSNDNIEHIKEYLLPNMIWTTLRMILGVSVVAIILAVPSAYFIANYQFPLRKFLKKANIFPLTIPTYIMGFVYASIFSITGSFTKLAMLFYTQEEIFSWNINVITEGWLMVFLGFSLYPYVYSSCLIHFNSKNKTLDEAGATMGVSPIKRFFKILLPLAIPSILAGTGLVVMEVINDYGAMSYFNVKTFTAGIFQAKQMDFSGSLYLSAILFIVITCIFSSVFIFRNLKKISKQKSSNDFQLKRLTTSKSIIVSVVCFFPFFLGFVIPTVQLMYLASTKIDVLLSREFLIIVINAIQLAIIPALIIVILSIILQYSNYLNKGKFMLWIANFSTLGYAIPGAVIGVAIFGFIFFIDTTNATLYNFTMNTLILLMFGYVVRFMAVGYNTIEANFTQISSSIPDASRSLGKNSFATFFKVHFPLLRLGMLTTLAVVTIDILKELPLTLILQPANFETLATKAYKKAKVAESVADASPYALLLIVVGVAVTLLLMREKKEV